MLQHTPSKSAGSGCGGGGGSTDIVSIALGMDTINDEQVSPTDLSSSLSLLVYRHVDLSQDEALLQAPGDNFSRPASCYVIDF